MSTDLPTPAEYRRLDMIAAVDLAGDALTEIYDALRTAKGMPTQEQVDAFQEAAAALYGEAAHAIASNRQENRVPKQS